MEATQTVTRDDIREAYLAAWSDCAPDPVAIVIEVIADDFSITLTDIEVFEALGDRREFQQWMTDRR